MAKKKHFNLYGFDGSTAPGAKHMRSSKDNIDGFYETDGPDGALKMWTCIIIATCVITIIGYILTR